MQSQHERWTLLAFDREEYERWLKQATNTLQSAQKDKDSGYFNWACFKAQQAAEFAVKGLLYGLGLQAVGHSLVRLLAGLERKRVSVSSLMGMARALDRHYIPTRYPNAYVSGAPLEYYDAETTEEALDNASQIVAFVEKVARDRSNGKGSSSG